MSRLSNQDLTLKARLIRREIIKMVAKAGSGHPGGALGLADIVAALYFSIMKLDPNDPSWQERDIFILSNGHTVPVQYAAMALRGFFDETELDSLRQFKSRLQGHPERKDLPGLENTSGPLGSGLSQAAGMAYSFKYLDQQPSRRVFVITGDGELDEGNIWEAMMFASKYQLNQLIVFVDRNNIQIDGTTDQVMPLADLRRRWQSFGWHTQEIDGHSFDSIHYAVAQAEKVIDKPSVIISHTIPGKGVKFMEHDYLWHGKAPSAEEAVEALRYLEDESE